MPLLWYVGAAIILFRRQELVLRDQLNGQSGLASKIGG